MCIEKFVAKPVQTHSSPRDAAKNTGVPVSDFFEDKHHDQKTTSSA
jgi:hypothetical protein